MPSCTTIGMQPHTIASEMRSPQPKPEGTRQKMLRRIASFASRTVCSTTKSLTFAPWYRCHTRCRTPWLYACGGASRPREPAKKKSVVRGGGGGAPALGHVAAANSPARPRKGGGTTPCAGLKQTSSSAAAGCTNL